MERPSALTGDSIRLLILRAGDKSDQLRCETEIVQLRPNSHYTAISYTWGDMELAKEVIINGQPTRVTRNV